MMINHDVIEDGHGSILFWYELLIRT